jgi:glycosyltransferase involved in cell wall biosynthesis
MPRITVVLPVFNHERYVEETLHSLFAQTCSDFEIVAVDDGSTDTSVEVLNRFRSQVTIIKGSHAGPAAARNRAIETTDSEFVAFMDADDVCCPERLRLSLGKLETENVDLVASALSFIDASGQSLPGEWARPAHAAKDHWGALLERNWIGTPSVMLRRKILDSTGLFDEGFTHAEDYDLWLRLGRAHSIGYIDSPLIQCRRHDANTSRSIGSHQRYERIALQKVDRLEAQAAFNRLYDNPQSRAEAWIWFLLRSGDSEFCQESLAAIERDPQSHSLRFASGVFRYDAGQYEKALVTFYSLKDRDAASLHNLGVVFAVCGDIEAAFFHLKAALVLCPGYHDAQYNLAALHEGRELRLTRRPFREHLVPMPKM